MITRDMFVEDMLLDYPQSNQFFLDKGLRCLKCGEAYWGSVEQFLEESSVEKIDEMIEELNTMLKEKGRDKPLKVPTKIETKKM